MYDKHKRWLLTLKGLNFTSQEKARVPGSVSCRLSISLSRLIYAMIPGDFQSKLFWQPERSSRFKKNLRPIFVPAYTWEKTEVYRLYLFIRLI